MILADLLLGFTAAVLLTCVVIQVRTSVHLWRDIKEMRKRGY